jgi:hypothetical protein
LLRLLYLRGHHEGQEPSATLGQLDTLSLQLFQPILLDLGLKSLTVLSSVNRTFRKTIDSIKEYDDIIAHAPTSLRVALSINLVVGFFAKNYITLHARRNAPGVVVLDRFYAFSPAKQNAPS